MKELKRDLQSMAKSLKVLIQRTEKMAEKVDMFEKPEPAIKPKRSTLPKAAKTTVAKKLTKLTATDTVLSIISASKGGINTAELEKKTGFERRKIWGIINRLKTLGEVKSESKGVYTKI